MSNQLWHHLLSAISSASGRDICLRVCVRTQLDRNQEAGYVWETIPTLIFHTGTHAILTHSPKLVNTLPWDSIMLGWCTKSWVRQQKDCSTSTPINRFENATPGIIRHLMRPLQHKSLASPPKQRGKLVPRPLLRVEERHSHQVHLPAPRNTCQSLPFSAGSGGCIQSVKTPLTSWPWCQAHQPDPHTAARRTR